MTRNLGNADRTLRIIGAISAIIAALEAPLSLGVRGAIGAMGGYLALTALAGTCIGYRMMGKSTCSLAQRT